jgi:alpha-amylase
VLKQTKREDAHFQVLNRDQIARILGTLTQEKAFFFYVDVGKPTGDSATSLSDFCTQINAVPLASLSFHLRRGDFENWIKNALGDTELANYVAKIRKTKTAWKRENTLRKKLYSVLRERVVELQDLWRHALTWPESAAP